MKFLYGAFSLSFALGYLGPVLLDPSFSMYTNSAVVGTVLGTVCSLLVFGVLHWLLTQDREPAEDLLDAIAVGRFSHFHAILFGSVLGAISGLVYPLNGWIRPFTGKSIEDLFGHFLWAPIGAVMVIAMSTTWCFSRRASQKCDDHQFARLKMQTWTTCVVIAVGVWLLFAIADLYPRHLSGIDLKAPLAWISVLPLFVIVGGIGSALSLGGKQTRVAQAVKDREKESIANMTDPIETFASTHGMRRLVEWAPNLIRVVPTGGMQLAGCLFMGSAFFVFALVAAIARWAPHLSDGAEFPLLIITPFLLIGLAFLTVPLRYTFDGSRKVIRCGNLWSSRKIPFNSVQAVQIIGGSQLNLITDNKNEPRLHIWDHDIEMTRYAADRLATLLKVEVLHVEQ